VTGPRILRRPVELARRAWQRKALATLIVVRAVPGRARRILARPVAAPAAWIARRSRATGFPQLALIARWAAGSPEAAAELAVELGTRDATPLGARRDLAILAATLGLPDAAGAIVDAIPEDETPAMDAIRVRVLTARGRYGEAAEAGRRAVAGGRSDAAGPLQVVEARLRVLDPAWEPTLGSARARLERLRGTPPVAGRILHLGSVSLPYRQVGYTVRSQAVGRCQQAVGLDPHFATRAGFPGTEGIRNAPADELVDGIPYHRLAPRFSETRFEDQLVTATAVAAVPLLERLRPAALQPASNHLQAQVALAVARPLGIPVVYEVRGFLEETWASLPNQSEAAALATDRYALSQAAETRAMLAADAVVTLSQTMRDAIVERGVAADKIAIVPNAVDVDHFRPLPRDLALASHLGLEPGDAVIGYISSLSPYEGIPYLLEAVATLRERGRHVRVAIVGDGRERESIEAAADRLGLHDGALIMPGRVPHAEIRRWYSLLDVFVVPRTGNRVSRLVTPLKPYEAMALERAIVVSDLPALREMIIPGETGMVFRPDDPADLADVIQVLLDDPALRERLGRQARAWVASERTWAQNGRRYRALFERLGVVGPEGRAAERAAGAAAG